MRSNELGRSFDVSLFAAQRVHFSASLRAVMETPSAAESSEPQRLVCFRLREQEIGIPIAFVRETIRMRPITRVFLTPPWVIGIFSLRGEIVPAIDPASWLGLQRSVVRDESRLIVLRHATKTLALLADQLADLRTLDPATITPPPPTLSAEQASVLSGVAVTPTGTVRIFNPDALFSSERLRTLEQRLE
ncbi:MAG: purine-binding chemotaxis protein CheW [Polyangiaceae bacterium]|nr:purine-binding chemotaxis protein CheW [Polyangiaceae bacterium]